MGAACVEEQLAAAMRAHRFDAIPALLASSQLEAASEGHIRLHALYLAGLIFNRRLEDARALWKRLPLDVRQNDAELLALSRVLQHLWQREFSAVWAALQGFAWSAQLQPVMAALAERLRAELLDMLGSAYSSVKPAKVAALCGLSEQDARRACLEAGWTWNEAKGTLSVART